MAYHPNPELVALYWLKGIYGIPADKVATQLPAADVVEDEGFITVTSVGGIPDMDTFMQGSRIQIDCWGWNADSNKLPWGKTYNLAMLIKEGVKDPARKVETPASFSDALVRQVIVQNDPRRIPDDAFAHVMFDVIIYWTEVQA